MSKGTMQRFTVLGRLGGDPEVIDTKTDLSVVRLNVATTERLKRKDQDTWEDDTSWHQIKAFGKLADFAKKFLKKGDTVYAEAKLRSNKWKDDKGNDRYSVDIIAVELQQAGKISRKGEDDDVKEDDPLKDVE